MRNLLRQLAACLLGCVCVTSLTACEEKPVPPGTLARVNGEDIHLHAVQALMDSRIALMGIDPRPSVKEMEINMASATAILIAHALVRQELAAKGLSVTDGELDETIAAIKKDYGKDGIGQFGDETPLREDEWRELMRDHLSLRRFRERILLPSIHISLQEVKDAYMKLQKHFRQPALWNICLKSAPARSELEAWCASLATDSPDMENCRSIPAQEVPDPWDKELKKIHLPGCGRILEQEGQWRTAAALSKSEPRVAAMAEVYPLLEHLLLEEKEHDAFEAWLANKLASSQIRTYPGLLAPKISPEKP